MAMNLLADMEGITPILMIALPLLLMLCIVILLIVFSLKYKRSYFFQYRSHEIVLQTSMKGVTLFVDGKVEDEFAAQNVRLCTMRAFVEGDEVKVRVSYRPFKGPLVQATADGKDLMLVKVEK